MKHDNRTAPADMDAEKAVLGSILARPETIDDVIAGLSGPEAFSDPTHAGLYRTLVDHRDAGEPIDFVSMSDRLARIGDCRVEYLVELIESFGDPANAGQYARIVERKHQLRRLIYVMHKHASAAYAAGRDPDAKPEELCGAAIADIERVGAPIDADATDVYELVARLPTMFASDSTVRPPIQIGIPPIDINLHGLKRGALTVVGAATSVGKTAFGLHCAIAAAIDSYVPALFVSVEMPRDEIVARISAHISDRPMVEIAKQSSDEDLRAIAWKVQNDLGRARLFILDGVYSIPKIVAQARAFVRKHGVGLVVVDYLQLCDVPGKFDTNNLRVAAMSKSLQRFALESGTAVMALSQLNRDAKGRPPVLSDLRDSGAIEQDANTVILLWRKNRSNTPTQEIGCDVAKNRNGPTFRTPLELVRPTMRFRAREITSIGDTDD